MTSSFGRSIFLAGASLIAGLAAAPALAQDTPPTATAPGAANPDAAQEGDIVVTALRRSENLQDVPAAIRARLGGDEFVVVVDDLDSESAALHAKRIARELRSTLTCDVACRAVADDAPGRLRAALRPSAGPDTAPTRHRRPSRRAPRTHQRSTTPSWRSCSCPRREPAVSPSARLQRGPERATVEISIERRAVPGGRRRWQG